jgi:hypothetical protein
VAQLRSEFVEIHFPNINNHFAIDEKKFKLLFVMENLTHFKLKKWEYAVKKTLSFGARHQKYQQKYDKVRALIKEAKRFKKRIRKI